MFFDDNLEPQPRPVPSPQPPARTNHGRRVDVPSARPTAPPARAEVPQPAPESVDPEADALSPAEVDMLMQSLETTLDENEALVTRNADLEQQIRDLAAGKAAEAQRADTAEAARAAALGEMRSIRARVEQQRELIRLEAITKLARPLLTTIDGFDLAIKHADDTHREGLQSLRASLVNALSDLGITEIGAQDAAFDPQLHEAVSTRPADVDVQTVVEVYRSGWAIGDRVIRPATVIVGMPA